MARGRRSRDDRTFIRIHDGIDEHPKLEELSFRAKWLFVEVLCYCSRNRSDGHLTQATWKRKGTPKARTELLEAGLVEDHGVKGLWVHDYLEHQSSAAEIDEAKRDKKAAGAKGNHVRHHCDEDGVLRWPSPNCPLCPDVGLFPRPDDDDDDTYPEPPGDDDHDTDRTSHVRSQNGSHVRGGVRAAEPVDNSRRAPHTDGMPTDKRSRTTDSPDTNSWSDSTPRGPLAPATTRDDTENRTSHMRSHVRSQNARKTSPDADPDTDTDPSGEVGRGGVGKSNATRCAKHAHIPPGEHVPPCGACRDLREADEAVERNSADARTTRRAARRTAIETCPSCDEYGQVLDPDDTCHAAVICDHRTDPDTQLARARGDTA